MISARARAAMEEELTDNIDVAIEHNPRNVALSIQRAQSSAANTTVDLFIILECSSRKFFPLINSISRMLPVRLDQRFQL
jgi:hypothetical protein